MPRKKKKEKEEGAALTPLFFGGALTFLGGASSVATFYFIFTMITSGSTEIIGYIFFGFFFLVGIGMLYGGIRVIIHRNKAAEAAKRTRYRVKEKIIPLNEVLYVLGTAVPVEDESYQEGVIRRTKQPPNIMIISNKSEEDLLKTINPIFRFAIGIIGILISSSIIIWAIFFMP